MQTFLDNYTGVSTFYYSQRKVRASGNAKTAEIAFDGFDCSGIAVFVISKHIVWAKFNAYPASFAPFVKNHKSNFWIFTLFLFLGIFCFGLFG